MGRAYRLSFSFAVADHVISQLKERGDPWGLNEEAKGGHGQHPRRI